MNRLDAIREIARTFDNDKWETTINDDERAEREQTLIDCLAALGVTPEEYEEAFS